MLKIKGRLTKKSDPGFEKAIMATLFNQHDPGRRPDLMVEPQDVDDIIAAVHYAHANGLKISVCSGGHSWSANHLREGSILINMKGFNRYNIDQAAMTATAGPGVGGSVLLGELFNRGLFFPAGHCKGVCIGGYLLQGGFAWNGRKLGLACESVIGLDIVTANGDYVFASPKENADLYWAARGAGAGFFGVVTCFHLQLYPRPKYYGMMAHVFSNKHLEHVFRWAHEVGPEVPAAVEFQLLMSQNALNLLGPGIEAVAPIFADSKDELNEAKAFLQNSPIKSKAMLRFPFFPLHIKHMYRLTMTHYPYQHHWGVDNMWTSASIDELMPHLKTIAATMPPPPAHLLWLNWQPPQRSSEMAFSMEDKIYIALYGAWKNPANAPQYEYWASEWMKKMEPLAKGIQLADEGLHKRTARFVSDAHLQKLDQVRWQHDPEGLFNPWHSRPKLEL
jgi:FAD/FMN-containing dehydrogenase